MTIATDLGVLTPPVHQALSGCDLVALESNYDLHMLRSGRYPYYLRSRIESNRGHLSNDECSAKLLELIQEGCKKFALCHLSQENNTPALALQTMFNTLGAAGVVPEKDCIVQAQRRNEISPARLHFKKKALSVNASQSVTERAFFVIMPDPAGYRARGPAPAAGR